MNEALVEVHSIVLYKSGTRILMNHTDHIELVIKLVPLVLVEDVHNLDRYWNTRDLMDSSHHHTSVTLTQYLSVFKVSLENLLISSPSFHVHIALVVKLDLSLVENYSTCSHYKGE